jgi:hypothetical protein
MIELYILLQDPTGIVLPKLFEYGIMGVVAGLAIAWGWIERAERIKIQDEKNKLYDERNNTQAQLERILEELKYLDR